MKITRVSLWHVPLTSHATYYMASGKACATVETVVLAVDTDAGLTGWGECCPIPRYLPAYARGHTGTILAHHGGHLYADAGAAGEHRGEHLYTVEFTARELWGTDDPDTICLDLWEPYFVRA